jgi:hypothetical protein
MTLRHISELIFPVDSGVAPLQELIVSYPIPKITEKSTGAVELALRLHLNFGDLSYLSSAPVKTTSATKSSKVIISFNAQMGMSSIQNLLPVSVPLFLMLRYRNGHQRAREARELHRIWKGEA